MSSRLEQVHGIVLQITPSGENFLRISLFGAGDGLQSVMMRKGRGKGLSSQPDVFDEFHGSLSFASSGSGGMPFVREFNFERGREYLAGNHKVFFAASWIARLFLSNGGHVLEPKPLYDLLLKALDGLRQGIPLAVRIKTLFAFAQLEGLPVKQAWMPGLPNGLGGQARSILSSRLADISTLPPQAEEILESLVSWLNAETEIKC